MHYHIITEIVHGTVIKSIQQLKYLKKTTIPQIFNVKVNYPLNSSTLLFKNSKRALQLDSAQQPLQEMKTYGVSHGLGSGTATTIPCSSCVRITWHPSLECLFKIRFLEFLFNTYCSSYDGGGSLSSHSCAM